MRLDKILYNSKDIAKIVSEKLNVKEEVVLLAIDSQIKYLKEVLTQDPEVSAVGIPYLGTMCFNVPSFNYYSKYTIKRKKEGKRVGKNYEKELSVGNKRLEKLLEHGKNVREKVGWNKTQRHFDIRLTSKYNITKGKTYHEIETNQKEEWKKSQN